MAYDDSIRGERKYGNKGPGAVLNTISFVGIVLGFLLIVNRIYWRWKKGTPGIDDAIIVFAWLGLVALGVVTYVAVDYGYGRHSITLTRAEASNAIRMFYFYQIFYKLSLNASKLSILTLYLRVFDTKDWFGRITKYLIFVVVAFTASIILTNVFICTPIHQYWNTSPSTDPSRDNGACINVLGYWYASSLYNIISEAVMLLSVLVRIWTLPSHSQPPILQFRQKINLTVVLGLGVFTVVTAILRVTTLDQANQQDDKTGATLVSTIWSSVEVCLALTVANLPMVRQLLRWRGWCGGRWFGSSNGRTQTPHDSRPRHGYTPSPAAGNAQNNSPYQRHRQDSAVRRPSHGKRNGDGITITSTGEILMQRDFRREVITASPSTSHDSSLFEDYIHDVEAQTQSRHGGGAGTGAGHIEIPPRSARSFPATGSATQRHTPWSWSLPPRSPDNTSLTFNADNPAMATRAVFAGTQMRRSGGSNASSFASTLQGTAGASAVEPLSMVRVANEPKSASGTGTTGSQSSLALGLGGDGYVDLSSGLAHGDAKILGSSHRQDSQKEV